MRKRKMKYFEPQSTRTRRIMGEKKESLGETSAHSVMVCVNPDTMKTLVKQDGARRYSSDSWVKCKTRGRLLETLDEYAGLTIRLSD
jgi:hypothetical protein